jgi:hypothetical protein
MRCTLAHLMAMKLFVDDGTFDVLMEDNMRVALASREWEQTTGKTCHLRYLGWLGSEVNLEWNYEVHIPQSKFERMTRQQSHPFRRHKISNGI